MVLVDTSIWIALYRKQRAETCEKMWMLAARNEAAVTGQIWVQFLMFREQSRRSVYEERLRAFPFLETTRAAYDLAAGLLAAHPRLGAGNAMIAATAISSDATLWTADRDFHDLTSDGLRLFS